MSGVPLRSGVVGVTGGMGSGKSSVAVLLAELAGAVYLSADALCRGLLEPDAPGWHALRDVFGDRFLLSDGRVDRPGFRQALFADAALRRTVDSLLHPLAREEVGKRIRQQTGVRQVVEVPLLFEAGWTSDFARVVVVYADAAICVARLMARDRISRDEAHQAMGAQMPLRNKVLLADHVIDNSGSWWETRLQVEQLRRVIWSHESGE